MKLPDLPESLSARRMRSHFPPTVLALYDNNYGLFLIATSMLFFAAMSLSVKYLMETTGMSTLTLILVRMGITGMCCWAVLWGVQRDPHPILGPPDIRRLLLLRGLCGFSGLLCAYQAFRYLSVSDTVTIQFLQPTVTGLLGWLLLKEPFTLREAAAGIVSLCGVVLISRPPFIFGHGWGGHDTPIEEAVPPTTGVEHDRVLGATWAIIGVFFSSGACEYYSTELADVRPLDPQDRQACQCTPLHRILLSRLHHCVLFVSSGVGPGSGVRDSGRAVERTRQVGV